MVDESGVAGPSNLALVAWATDRSIAKSNHASPPA